MAALAWVGRGVIVALIKSSARLPGSKPCRVRFSVPSRLPVYVVVQHGVLVGAILPKAVGGGVNRIALLWGLCLPGN